jgi:hypothetical protein
LFCPVSSFFQPLARHALKLLPQLNCNQAATELVTERQKLTVLEANQNLAATTDALAVFLVLVPVSKITGGDKAGEVGSSKGKVIALEQRLSTCK